MNKKMNLKGSIYRREFLKVSGLTGLGLISYGLIPLTAQAISFNKDLYKVSRTKIAMGTFVSITLLHSSKDEAEEALGRAYEEIFRLTGLLSRFDKKTAISHLNDDGVLNDISPEISHVLSRAFYYYDLTNGAFDVSVKPLIDLFSAKFSKDENGYPNKSEITEALKLVGLEKVEFRNNSIRFKEKGMGITLDGIAKGYIVDCASEVLNKHHIKNYLINAGGDIRVAGRRSQKRAWTIAIQDPDKKGKHPDIIHLSDGAIATSGNYEVYFDREKMFHHIVNPITGISPRLSSVSISAPSTMEADALSTGVFVMNPEDGIRFINSLPYCESLIIERNNKKSHSKGWKSLS